MTTPDSLKYTKEHEWIRLDGKIATIGITEYAQRELGDIVYVTLPGPGTPVRQMAVFGTVEAVKTVSDLYAPVTGKVTEINESLSANPELVNSSPYENGWMIRVELSDPSELEALLSATTYREQIGESA
jgi:glycine cleavage system H protein